VLRLCARSNRGCHTATPLHPLWQLWQGGSYTGPNLASACCLTVDLGVPFDKLTATLQKAHADRAAPAERKARNALRVISKDLPTAALNLSANLLEHLDQKSFDRARRDLVRRSNRAAPLITLVKGNGSTQNIEC
jgi:hypothetical protein